MLFAFFLRGLLIFYKKSKKKTLKKVLFLENQPKIHAGAKYRVQILKPLFESSGIELYVKYPFNNDEYRNSDNINSNRIHLYRKLSHVISSFKYDSVIVRRELLHQIQYGNHFLEKLLLKIHPNAILDMDDYMPDLRKFDKAKSLFSILCFHNKNKTIESLGMYKFHTVALASFKSELLKAHPSLNSENIHVFPMCLDYKDDIKKIYRQKNKIIGWISHHQHFKRLDLLSEELNIVSNSYPLELHVVADKPYENNKLNFPIINKKWNLKNEVEYMLKFDIGIAPIDSNNEVIKRKGTFKLIQYMALGIVSLTTRFPYSSSLINDGINGFLTNNDSEWHKKLLHIFNLEPTQMNKIGENSYITFKNNHHISNQFNELLCFYKSTL